MSNLYTLSLDSIKYILGLIRDTVDLPTTILDDLHIQSTTTYSSYRLDTLLKALKEENIQYCDEAISKLNKLSKEIITDKLQITNENTIYLLLTDPVDNIYEQWLLINGTPQMIGTTEMKLDSVYTKDEADDRYALLTDFNTLTTSFNNLVTSVEKKIDKDKIVTVLDDTVTDEQVPSAKVVYEELDKKIEGDNVVKKDDIVTVLDDTVTDDEVASAKVVYDELDKVFQSVSSGKELIANAITDKGVNTAIDAEFAIMADNIKKISSGGSETIPTSYNKGTIGSGKIKDIILDISKTYFVTTAVKYTETASTNRVAHFFITNGVLYKIINTGEATSSCSLTGDKLTIRNTNSTYRIDYTVLQM